MQIAADQMKELLGKIRPLGEATPGEPHTVWSIQMEAPNLRGVICFRPEEGAFGLSDELIIGVLIMRLRELQAGPRACPEDIAALSHLNEALYYLYQRKARPPTPQQKAET